MSGTEQGFFPAREVEIETVVQKSKFITRVFPVNSEEEARALLEKVRELHRDANHNVYAYRVGTAERCSDDGEPSGTAGRPVLEVILREQVKQVLVVVTRYFGGIKLGAGGLIRAYAQSAKGALEQAGKRLPIPYRELVIFLEYNLFDRIQHIVGLRGYHIENVVYAQNIEMKVLAPVSEVEEFCTLLREVSAGALDWQLGGETLRCIDIKVQD
ncbi:MAG TPA: YigZ family protein [Verrucomicrobiae bacterium]|nr:YigZ family protein [Verrucomicrobiae bacterium]